MFKTVVLLAFCVPLGWLAWDGLQKLQQSRTPTPVAGSTSSRPDPTPPAAPPLRDDVVEAFLTLGPPPAARPSGKLAEQLLAFSQARAAIDGNPAVKAARQREKQERRALKQRRDDLLGDGGAPRDRSGGPGSLRPLAEVLDEYRRLDAHDDQFAAEVRADLRGAELDLAGGPAALDAALAGYGAWAPAKPRPAPDTEAINGILDQFEAYFKDYGGGVVPGPAEATVKGLRQLEGQWRLVLRLSEAFDAPDPGTRLGLAADFAEEDGHPDAVRQAARRAAVALADAFLPREPLDQFVNVVTDAVEEKETRVLRNELKIHWLKVPEGATQDATLGASPLDEFAITRDQVDYFQPGRTILTVKKGPGQDRPPLKATPYSEAVRRFNMLRDEVRPEAWSGKSLRELEKYARGVESDLSQGGGKGSGGPTLLKRIRTLIELIETHPAVFPGP